MADELNQKTKKLILSVVTSTPDSLTIARLKKDFLGLVGDDIPFRKLGYDSLELYLLSISDTVSVLGRGQEAIVKAHYSEKSAHVENLIARQKKTSGNKYRRPPRYGNNYRATPRCGNNMQPLVGPPPGFYNQWIPSQQFHRPSLMSQYYPPPPSCQMDMSSRVFQPQRRPTSSNPSTYRPYQQMQPTFNRSSTPNIDSIVTKTASPSLFHDQHNSRIGDADNVAISTVNATNNSIVSTVNTTLERMSISSSREMAIIPGGLETPSAKINISYYEDEDIFTDNDDDIPELPNSAALVSCEKPLELASASANGSTGGTVNLPITFAYNIRVPREVQNNLIQLITQDEHDEGIWCGKLPDIYKELFGSNLNVEQYGFPSLLAMCLELPGIFFCIQIRRGDYKVFDSRKPYPKDIIKMNSFVRKLENINTAAFHQLASNTLPLPEDHMSADYFAMNDQIPRLDLSSILSQGDVIPIKIAEIYDPSKFWLQIMGAEFSDKLDSLMRELGTFYADKKSFLVIPKEKMEIGLICCTIYEAEFHRAVIVDINSSKSYTIKVFYLDYGTISKVAATDILYLHRRFGSLSQQAVRARIAGIYPREAKTPWSRAAGQRFFELVSGRELFGQIDKINEKRQEMEIFLIDTSSDVDMHISDALVEEGLAIFTYDEQTIVKLDWQFEPIVHYIHLYPTFQELETGRVLTISEMDQLYELRVPYYVAYNHYFCQKETQHSFGNADFEKVPAEVIDDILETNLTTTIVQTANWVQSIDNTNISDISIVDIETAPFRRVITIECDGENLLLIHFNKKVHLIVHQLLNYFKKNDLSIIRIRRLCVHLGIIIPCLTERINKELFQLGIEHLNTIENAINLLSAEDVPIFYEKIFAEQFSFDDWPNIAKILNFSSDIWVR